VTVNSLTPVEMGLTVELVTRLANECEQSDIVVETAGRTAAGGVEPESALRRTRLTCSAVGKRVDLPERCAR